MINSRKIEDLTPEAQVKCRQFLAACATQGLIVKLTQTLRDAEYQKSLYAKGRTAPGAIVTNADGFRHKSKHQSGNAWDAVPCSDKGVILWNDMPKFKLMADIATNLGITAGFYFKSISDHGHFEIN